MIGHRRHRLECKKILVLDNSFIRFLFYHFSLLHFLQHISAHRGSVKGQGYRGRSSIAPVPVLTSTIHGHSDKLELTLGYSSHVPRFTIVKFTSVYKCLQVFTTLYNSLKVQ